MASAPPMQKPTMPTRSPAVRSLAASHFPAPSMSRAASARSSAMSSLPASSGSLVCLPWYRSGARATNPSAAKRSHRSRMCSFIPQYSWMTTTPGPRPLGGVARYPPHVCPLLGNSTVSPIAYSFTACGSVGSRGAPRPRARTPGSCRRMLAGVRLDELLSNVRGHFLVARECHRIPAASLGHRAQLDRERVHLRLGHVRVDLGSTVTERVHATNAPALRVEQPHDVAGEALGDGDLDVHDRLEDHRGGLLHRFAHGHRPRDLKCDVLAVDAVGRAVDQAHLDVDDGIPGHRSLLHGLADALL